ncbi:hypothetical protein NCGM2209_0892 [Mycobacterium tuberculosis NCGM2209]|nr:hypothetical protein NCGM2209_0892 [Mycobacterium tuberculosis NCGM2209]
MGVLVFAQGQADDVDVVLGDRVSHGGTPAAADVEQRHAGLKVQLVQCQLALRVLRLFQRHIGTFEVGAAVRHRWVKPELEELVRFVVVGSNCFDRRLELRAACRVAL